MNLYFEEQRVATNYQTNIQKPFRFYSVKKIGVHAYIYIYVCLYVVAHRSIYSQSLSCTLLVQTSAQQIWFEGMSKRATSVFVWRGRSQFIKL